MLGRLFLLFTLVPLIELYLLVKIGGLVGVGPTSGIVALTGFFGAKLASREGRKALASYQKALAEGKMPEEGIVSGLLILAGGVTLITPGVLTDVFGLAMMVPPVRRATAKLVKKRIKKRIESGEIHVVGSVTVGGGFGPPQYADFDSKRRGEPEGEPAEIEGSRVVDAEVVD